MNKKEAIQAYMDWIATTPEFKEAYLGKIKEYWDEILGPLPPTHP